MSETTQSSEHFWSDLTAYLGDDIGGMLARLVAIRIASAFGASYRQYVSFLSAPRNETSHLTPSSSLI
jgi:hypothetical protein